MKLGEFLEEGTELDVEESGMTTVIGLGGYEQLGETYFGWTQEEPYKTAAVTLDLGPDTELSEGTAKRIIEKLGLPVRKGMTASELVAIFGRPQKDEKGRPGLRLLDFICGEDDKYIVGCFVDERDGLIEFFLARKDYCDEADSA